MHVSQLQETPGAWRQGHAACPPSGTQWLNVGIFRAIGHAGVYYGFKLGHSIPWVTGFPFNVVSHPQYVGSVATVLGAAALVRRGCRRACPGTGGAC